MKKNTLPVVCIAIAISILCSILMLRSNFYLIALMLLVILVMLASKSSLLFLITLVVIYAKGFQIIDFGIPHWMYKDVALMALCVGLIVQFIKNGSRLQLTIKNNYFRYILVFLLIVFFSIFIGSWWIYKQPISSLIFSARPFFLYFTFLYL